MDTKINAAANRTSQVGTKSAGKPAPKPELPPNLPAELFTPEALEACPHARAMFERMKSMEQSPQPQGPSLQSVKLAEEGSWIQEKAPANFQPKTEATGQWSRRDDIEYALKNSPKNVPDNALEGREMADFRAFTRERIDTIQERQLEDGGCMHRLVHTEQLFGGEVEMHWNPNMESVVELFGLSSQGGIVRFSDAANKENPDGKSMYGLALELVGNDGQVTDILLTGGDERTEASQAKDPKAQLALFNMLDHPNKVAGLAKMGWEVGPVEAGRMVVDVGRMKTDLNSVADLTAWSRAPFRLTGKDGNDYLVKMRATPVEKAPAAQPKDGETTSERLEREFKELASKQDVRWNFELQFMEEGDDPNDGRKAWSGPWLKAGEMVVPKITDQTRAAEMEQVAEDTKFNIWKGKEDHNKGPDKEVFYPHGFTNQARLWAYGMSAKNRGASH